jgi:uncharacterized damage-inducible protein DinB
MISKQDLIKLLNKEFATTSKVLRAFPSASKDFKPHDRSSDVTRLASTFVFEMYLAQIHLLGTQLDRSVFKTYKPDSMDALIGDFEKETSALLRGLEQLSESDLGRTVEFAGAKFAADEFMLMMLLDQIHHRGQMTVYIRLAGGKVPSVYGPSADDPSTNF